MGGGGVSCSNSRIIITGPGDPATQGFTERDRGGGREREGGEGERERRHGFYRPFTRRGSHQDEMRMIESVESQQRGESQTDRQRDVF